MNLGLFGRKNKDGNQPPSDGAPGGDVAGGGTGGNGDGKAKLPPVAPDKAAKFFEHAKNMQDATNYEYAMQLWLNGLRQDPTSMRGMEAFFESCKYFLADDTNKLSKETRGMFDGKGEAGANRDIERYLQSLLQWGVDPFDALLAVRAAENASKLGLVEPTYWIGERALGAVWKEKKPRKDLFLKLSELFAKVNAADKAVQAAQAALQLDPTDGKLAAEVRNLSAQATMTKGGYDKTGQAGGFRANVRDAEKQRHLEEGERIVKSEETLDRLVAAAAEDYQKRSEDPAAINVYAQRLTERGRPEDEKRALEVLDAAFKTTKQFRFRQMWGDLRLRRAARKVLKYKEEAAAGASPKAADVYKQAQTQYVQMEIEEIKLRVENYPTDLGLKFQLGRRYFEHGDFEQAISHFQQSQEDAKNRVESLRFLGLAFIKISWTDEAEATFRKALEAYKNHSDEIGMELRYGLLTALQTKAETGRDLAVAEEADKLASTIAIQQINFKDIRARRDALKKLIAEIKRGDAA